MVTGCYSLYMSVLLVNSGLVKTLREPPLQFLSVVLLWLSDFFIAYFTSYVGGERNIFTPNQQWQVKKPTDGLTFSHQGKTDSY